MEWFVIKFLITYFLRDSICNDVSDIQSQYVLQNLADIISDKKLKLIWKYNKFAKVDPETMGKYLFAFEDVRQNESYFDYIYKTEWLIRLLGIKYNYDYSDIDFSDMDLHDISLSECRNKDSVILSLPKNPEYFKNTFISENTFSVHGHRGKINSICQVDNMGMVISGDDEGIICFWDVRNNKLISMKRIKNHINDESDRNWAITDIKCFSHKEKYLIACSSLAGLVVLYEIDPDNDYNRIGYISCKAVFKDDNKNQIGFTTINYLKDDSFDILVVGTSTGEIYRWEINSEWRLNDLYDDSYYTITQTLGQKNGVNKICIFDFIQDHYCVVAKADYSIDIWNLTKKEFIRSIKVSEKLNEVDDYAFIENSFSETKDMWNNSKKGITDVVFFI